MTNLTIENFISISVLLLTFIGVCTAITQIIISVSKNLKMDFNYHFLFNPSTGKRVGTMGCLKIINNSNKNITIDGMGIKLQKQMHTILQTGIIIGDRLPATILPSGDISLFIPINELQNIMHSQFNEQKINTNTKIEFFVYDNQGKEYWLKTNVNIQNIDNFARI